MKEAQKEDVSDFKCQPRFRAQRQHECSSPPGNLYRNLKTPRYSLESKVWKRRTTVHLEWINGHLFHRGHEGKVCTWAVL